MELAFIIADGAWISMLVTGGFVAWYVFKK